MLDILIIVWYNIHTGRQLAGFKSLRFKFIRWTRILFLGRDAEYN